MERDEAGFTLVEVLVALLLVGVGLLSLAPMFARATRSVATSGDIGDAGARAVQRLELLRTRLFDSLTAGGSLGANQAGFYDASDPRVLVRWTIVNDSTPVSIKTITVRAIATRQVLGLAKEARMATRRAR
jgi:prepilin-type N-terminal cleavage/methylation domain-containing protein